MFRIISDDIIMTGFFHKAFQTRNKKNKTKQKQKTNKSGLAWKWQIPWKRESLAFV